MRRKFGPGAGSPKRLEVVTCSTRCRGGQKQCQRQAKIAAKVPETCSVQVETCIPLTMARPGARETYARKENAKVPCENGNRIVREQDKSFRPPTPVHLPYCMPSLLSVVYQSPSKSYRCIEDPPVLTTCGGASVRCGISSQ
jgi:hypothetical protein